MARLSMHAPGRGLGLRSVFALAVYISKVAVGESDQLAAVNDNYYSSCLSYAISVRVLHKPNLDKQSLIIVHRLVTKSWNALGSIDDFISALQRNFTNEKELQGDRRDDVKEIIEIYVRDLKKKTEADSAYETWHRKVMGADLPQLTANSCKLFVNKLTHDINMRNRKNPNVNQESQDIVRKVIKDSFNGDESMRDFIINLIENTIKEMKVLHADALDDVKRTMDMFVGGLLKKGEKHLAHQKRRRGTERNGFDQLSVNHKDYYATSLDYAITERIKENPDMDEESLDIIGNIVTLSYDEGDSMQDFIDKLTQQSEKELVQLQGNTHDDVKKIMDLYMEDFMEKARADLPYDKWQSLAVGIRLSQLPANYDNYHANSLVDAIGKQFEDYPSSDLESKYIVLRMVGKTFLKKKNMHKYITELIEMYRKNIKTLEGHLRDGVQRIMDVYIEDLLKKSRDGVNYMKWQRQIESHDYDELTADHKNYYKTCLVNAINKRVKDKPTMDQANVMTVWEMVNKSFREYRPMHDFITKLIERYRKNIEQLPEEAHDDVKNIVEVYLDELMKNAEIDITNNNWTIKAMQADLSRLLCSHNNYSIDCLRDAIRVRNEGQPNTDMASLQIVQNLIMRSHDQCDSMLAFIIKLHTIYRMQKRDLHGGIGDDVKRLISVYAEDVIKKSVADITYSNWQLQAMAEGFDQLINDQNDYYADCLDYAISVRINENPDMNEARLDIVSDIVMDSFEEKQSMMQFITKLSENYRDGMKDLHGETYGDVKEIMNVYIEDLIKKVEADIACEKWQRQAEVADLNQLPIDRDKYNGCLDNAINVWLEDNYEVDMSSEDIVRDMVKDALKECHSMLSFMSKLITNYRQKVKQLQGVTFDDVKNIMNVYVEDLMEKAAAS